MVTYTCLILALIDHRETSPRLWLSDKTYRGLIQIFSLCDWYVNDIPEDNIVSLHRYKMFNFSKDSIITLQKSNIKFLKQ